MLFEWQSLELLARGGRHGQAQQAGAPIGKIQGDGESNGAGDFKFQMALLTSCVFTTAMERGEYWIALRRRK